MMVGLAGVLTRHARVAITAMTRGCYLVGALRFRAVRICLRRWCWLEVIGVNLLLRLGEYRE
jgi:hypothetical protein